MFFVLAQLVYSRRVTDLYFYFICFAIKLQQAINEALVTFLQVLYFKTGHRYHRGKGEPFPLSCNRRERNMVEFLGRFKPSTPTIHLETRKHTLVVDVLSSKEIVKIEAKSNLRRKDLQESL